MIRYQWEVSVWLIVFIFMILMIASFVVANGQEISGYCEGNITWLDKQFCEIPP